MADCVIKTPPTDRKKSDAPDREGQFSITAINREQHTIDLNVSGCPVTLICSPQNNPKPYQQIKKILLDVVVGAVSQK